MQQVQNINKIKLNIKQIISDCKKYRFSLKSYQKTRSNTHFKTQGDENHLMSKKFDYDTCVQSIKKRVKSLNSGLHCGEQSNREQQRNINVSQFSAYSQNNGSLSKISPSKTLHQSRPSLPRLMQRYDRAHNPKNASSSQKYTFLDKDQKQHNMTQLDNQCLSYEQLKNKRYQDQQILRISTIGRLIKQNVNRQKKVLVEKKKQRRLQNLNLKQIIISRSCINIK